MPESTNSRWLAIALPIVVLCGFASAIQSTESASRPPGQRAVVDRFDALQDFNIKTLDADGMRALLGRSRGRSRPLALFLFYTACQPCTDRLPAFQKVYDELRSSGLDAAAVSIRPMDDETRLAAYLGASKIHLPVYLLGELSDEMAEEFFLPDWEAVVPSVFFYDSSGRLIAHLTDARDINYEALHRLAVESLKSNSRSR